MELWRKRISDNITLDNATVIREWAEKHLKPRPLDSKSTNELLADAQIQEELTPDKAFYGVQHFFSTQDGDPLIVVQRVFDCDSAEDALEAYLGEAAERVEGRGESYISFKIYDNLWYPNQEIRVLKLVGDSFF